MAAWIAEQHDCLLSLLALAAIGAGGLLHAAGAAPAGDAVLAISVAVLLASLTVHVGRALPVEHRLGVDVIALVAMAGALALGEYLAGAVAFARAVRAARRPYAAIFLPLTLLAPAAA